MIGEAKPFFSFEDFNQECLDVSVMVTNVTIILQQCFKITFMVIKYHSQCALVYFFYHIVKCSRTEHSNKRAITKLRFHYRIKN